MKIFVVLEHLIEKGFSRIVYAGRTSEKIIAFLKKNLETQSIDIYDFDEKQLVKDLNDCVMGKPIFVDGKDLITVHGIVVE